MTRGIRLFSAFLLAAVLGCHPSGTEVCKKGCEKVGSCNGNTSGMIVDCKTVCENNDPIKNCKNADKIADCYNSCYDKACNEINQCTGGCEQCVL
jgi:hypothetical protein